MAGFHATVAACATAAKPTMPPIPPAADPCAVEPLVLVLMGVSGSGKTTVAAILAERLGWAFEEGDALHPPANVEKMRAGHPLDDADRAPWLARVAEWVAGRLDAGACGVITCSALKRRYREAIARGRGGVLFVYLSGPRDEIADRLAARQGHFMPASLLASQMATLEEPGPDEPAIRIDVGPPPHAVADAVVAALVQRGLLRPEAPHGRA
jgi:carbohydrate kinase (thermoresistant glucokinase family)